MEWTRSRFYKPILVLLAVLLLVAASFVQQGLNQTRRELGLTRKEPLENAPPVLAFTTVALGSFRGIIANLLWMRASQLQMDGKYFELVQLADWITKLQPTFAPVWVFQAWNLTYNISVKFKEPHDKWLWVYRGIEMLRDEGIPYNPKEVMLYRELAWFFQHKLGADLDDAHFYYKRVWAEKMQELIPGGRADYEVLLNPSTQSQSNAVKRLRQEYKLLPEHMKRVDDTYGPLDWRLPETHAIYWAMLGLERATKGDMMTLRRAIYQPMQLSFRRGRIIEMTENNIFLGPNLDIVDRTNAAYERMKQQDPDYADHIGNAHENFLRDAVYFLYTYNRIDEARKWFNYVREKYPGSIPQGMDLASYALSRVGVDVTETSRVRTEAIIEGVLFNAYLSLAIGEDDRATQYMSMARTVHARYMEKVEGAEQRVGLRPFPEMHREFRERMLDPQRSPFSPELRARLITALGIDAPQPSSPSSPQQENDTGRPNQGSPGTSLQGETSPQGGSF